jgi:transcriptional regulator with XRE-family HTH domain
MNIPYKGNKMIEIATEIKKRRKERKLSQSKAAQLAGVSLNVIRAIEGGKSAVQVNGLMKALKLFGMEITFKEIR